MEHSELMELEWSTAGGGVEGGAVHKAPGVGACPLRLGVRWRLEGEGVGGGGKGRRESGGDGEEWGGEDGGKPGRPRRSCH